MTRNLVLLIESRCLGCWASVKPIVKIKLSFSRSGNSNLVYTIIRKRNVFHQLANLPADHHSIARALTKRGRGKVTNPSTAADLPEQPSMEGSTPATEAEPGTLKVSLAATPGQYLHPTLFLLLAKKLLLSTAFACLESKRTASHCAVVLLQ